MYARPQDGVKEYQGIIINNVKTENRKQLGFAFIFHLGKLERSSVTVHKETRLFPPHSHNISSAYFCPAIFSAE